MKKILSYPVISFDTSQSFQMCIEFVSNNIKLKSGFVTSRLHELLRICGWNSINIQIHKKAVNSYQGRVYPVLPSKFSVIFIFMLKMPTRPRRWEAPTLISTYVAVCLDFFTFNHHLLVKLKVIFNFNESYRNYASFACFKT